MLSEKIKYQALLKARVADLERAIATDLRDELARLPRQFGFSDTASFVAALRRASSEGNGKRTPSIREGGSRKRARITDEIRSRVREMVEEGATGAVIAKRVGISLPSVHNIKSALGLVKRRAQQ
jgi:hypothetical protein